jgi:hypothetical protein
MQANARRSFPSPRIKFRGSTRKALTVLHIIHSLSIGAILIRHKKLVAAIFTAVALQVLKIFNPR